MRHLLTAVCLLLALPVLGVLGAWLTLDPAALAVLRHQLSTVLPEYALQSALLAAGVGVGVVVLGSATAAAVTLFEFPGRRAFEWALLLPLAMPAYVLAYAWTDALQYSSPLQAGLGDLLGRRQPLWPDVRSLPGAVVLLPVVPRQVARQQAARLPEVQRVARWPAVRQAAARRPTAASMTSAPRSPSASVTSTFAVSRRARSSGTP